MTHFDHAAFQVSDLDRSLKFYAEKLGFTLVSRAVNPREQEAYAFLALGDLRLELIQLIQPTPLTRPDPQPPYCPHLAITISDMAQSVANLNAAGVTILRGPLEIEGEETWVYFCDPDNNILEYIQWFRED